MPLVVIEGSDGSGKETQSLLLAESLRELGYDVTLVAYPNYKSESAYCLKKFLGKEYSKDLNKLSPYMISSFYSINRFDDFLTKWKDDYEAGNVIIIDRYTGSNIIHQAPRLKGKEQREFIKWIQDFEQTKSGLPKPDITLYLDVPLDEQREILKTRKSQKSGNQVDILEENVAYAKKCRDFVLKNIERLGWHLIKRDEIPNVHNTILEKVLVNITYTKQGCISYAEPKSSKLDIYRTDN